MTLETRLRELKPNVSESTIKTYASSIKRLRKIDENLAYGPISQYLKQLPSVTNALNLLTAVIVLEGRERYGILYDSFIETARQLRGSQTFSKAEKRIGLRVN